MYEKILVPLDGSKVGEAALPFVEELVAKLAPASHVEVTLIRVIASLTHWIVAGEAAAPVSYTKEELELIEQKANDYLYEAGEGLRSRGAIVKTRVSVGNAADEINKAADEINVGLVAMSTHGRSGLGRLAFGSVTARVLRGGNVPILMVRAPKETGET